MIAAEPLVDRPGRCRLCTANDREALYDHVAAAMWERRRHGTLDDRPWPDAGSYWRTKFIELAEDAVEAMAADHGHME